MSSSQYNSPLVGSVFERKLSSRGAAPPTWSKSKTGFPAALHRSSGKSKSTFLKSREAQKTQPTEILTRSQQIPPILPSQALAQSSENDWRAQISRENELRVQNMTEEEREREKQEILERFGADVGEILRRARDAREKMEKASINLEEVPLTSEPVDSRPSSPRGSPPPSSLSTASTRPNSPSRASRKLRFAELTADHVHVYESAPPSPRKRILALPPPDKNESDTISLGTFKNSSILRSMRDEKPLENALSLNGKGLNDDTEKADSTNARADPDEGTPEFIRRRYFPDVSADNPDLAWMAPPPSAFSSSGLRFDLNGQPIPSAKSLSLPAHLGLHHHAEGTHAGYTLDDIFLLSRSSVKAQRAAMLGILKGLAKWWKYDAAQASDEEIRAAAENLRKSSPESPPLLKRILFAGLEAFPERGVVGVRAVEVVWECLVGDTKLEDDYEHIYLGGVELAGISSESDLISALPLSDIMPQFIRILTSPPDDNTVTTSVQGTPTQQLVLSILHRLATYSNTIANEICSSSTSELGLVVAIFKTFIHTPSIVVEHSIPNLHAIRFLTTLAMASRANAKILCGSADLLLRFVVTALSALQSSEVSSVIHSHIQDVLVETLYFYAALARYGMYAHIATDAREIWWKLSSYIDSLASAATTPKSSFSAKDNSRLVAAWASLLGGWIICATDPHQTTPSHDILWSQVVGWEWGKQLLSLAEQLSNLRASNEGKGESSFTWTCLHAKATVWGALAAWLEGVKVNGIKGGEQERAASKEVLQILFQQVDGREGLTITNVAESLIGALNNLTEDKYARDENAHVHSEMQQLSHQSYVLMSAIRLWLACCPPSSAGPLTSPPFELPFARISELCARLAGHSVWPFMASLSIKKSRTTPYIPLLCRPLSTLLVFYVQLCQRLPEASEDLWLAQAFSIILTLQRGDEEHALMILQQILGITTFEWASSRGLAVSAIWEKNGLEIIRPFLTYDIRPDHESYVSPLCASPRSVSMSTSLRLPCRTSSLSELGWKPLGLPLRKDWALSPVDHVLRSGSEHSLFSQKGLLPPGWDANETEIVRASLLFALVGREVVQRFAGSMVRVTMSREEVVFGCMKVFMLEHGQDHNKSTQEVFRDNVVNKLMEDLIHPYTFAVSHSRSQATPAPRDRNLEEISIEFLGSSTPFYQFYTDFVALYDAISFSQPLFSRLLFPPTSMRYPVDYRRHLWDDFSHIVKGIRISVDQVISCDIREYLWPVETNPRMIGAYLRALIKYGSSLSGFVRLIAIHHVACNIWRDLQAGDEVDAISSSTEDKASRLLRAVLEQGSKDVVRELVRYRQEKDALLLPPVCFNDMQGCQEERVRCVQRWGGEELLQKIELLFNE